MVSLNNKLQDFFVQPTNVYARTIARRIILSLAFFFLLMIILSTDFIADKVSFEVGQVSDRDVISPRTVVYVNAAKTKNLEMEVLASVANVYDIDVAITTRAEESIGSIFKTVGMVVGDKTLNSSEEKMEKMQKLLTISLPNSLMTHLIALDEKSIAIAEEQTKMILRKYFQRGIRDDDLAITKKNIVLETEELGLDNNTESVVAGITQVLLRPNFILNMRETEKRKQSAIANLEPVRETVKKGQIMVRRGDIVSAEQIHGMEEIGLSRGHGSEIRIFGLAIFVLLIMLIILGYMYKFAHAIYQDDLKVVLLGLIILMALVLGKAAHYYSDFIAPVAVGALLATILIDARIGFLVSIVLSLLFGIIADYNLRAVSTVLVGSMIGIYSVSKMAHGYSLTRTGLCIAVINFLVIGSTGFIEQLNGSQIFRQGMMGVFSGIGAAVITTGILPYLENIFNITTPLKLLDLAQPNHPLLQRLLLDAPGTYHHSVMVGNLAETAADHIGADPVTVRVGAYYHDIGKIKRPCFFVENQVGNENPHDKIAPSLSTLIVTSHIKDGVDLCNDYKLPQVIIDIVQQHHGTMLVSYFYKQATENEHGECIIEADFRYEGPRPRSKEAALIMLADACEAAVRSINKPNANRIEATVRKLIRERLHDGQLDECNLTLKDLNIIGDVFIRVLSSMFHKRIEYPDAVKELERRKNKNGNSIKQPTGKDGNYIVNGTNSDVGVAKNC
ncbi:HD family phosphohydrolase [Pelosinus sp. sgz500959]|uniref:HD family phosphohydrolase n=1 Tax=Pelosinus sp. sgz500959 TaxID=3242472 RepID=UPI00366B0CE4